MVQPGLCGARVRGTVEIPIDGKMVNIYGNGYPINRLRQKVGMVSHYMEQVQRAADCVMELAHGRLSYVRNPIGS